MYGSYGSKILNFNKWYTNFYASSAGAAMSVNTLNSFSLEPGADNSHAKTPVVESISNFSTNTQSNSWYVENGSYARLKNLQLMYDVPSSLCLQNEIIESTYLDTICESIYDHQVYRDGPRACR
ncbi:MAG: hypothetical protein WDO15_09565 [Bacteroidota bacterium]